jgi:hypothetical protein
MKPDFIDRFASSVKNVVIYVTIKLLLSSYLLYLFFLEEEFAIRIILLAGIFILILAMIPVILIFVMVRKHNAIKKVEESSDENKNISEK